MRGSSPRSEGTFRLLTHFCSLISCSLISDREGFLFFVGSGLEKLNAKPPAEFANIAAHLDYFTLMSSLMLGLRRLFRPHRFEDCFR